MAHVVTAEQALQGLDATCISLMVLLTAFFSLRYYSRLYHKPTHLGLDDLLVVLSYVTGTVICALGLTISHIERLGHPLAIDQLTGTPEQILHQLRPTLAYIFSMAQLLFIGFTAPKLSLIALYLRVFPNTAVGMPYRRACYGVGAALLIIWISFAIAQLNACTPVRHFWDKTVPGKCFNENAFYRAVNIIDILEDLAVLSLPIKPVLSLHASRGRRTGCLTMFLASIIGTAMSIARCVQFFKYTSTLITPHYSAELLPYLVAEPCVYACACELAGCGPVLNSVRVWCCGLFLRREQQQEGNRVYEEKGPAPGQGGGRMGSSSVQIVGSAAAEMGSERARQRDCDIELLDLRGILRKTEISVQEGEQSEGASPVDWRIQRHV